jgi:uncharacterized membrane protein YGL010W
MRSLTDHLAQYAGYHRDKRNLWTHVIGIPMIVLAVAILLARVELYALPIESPSFRGLISLSATAVLTLVLAAYYLRLDWRYGMVMLAWLIGCCLAGEHLARQDLVTWLTWGGGLFVLGWVFQFVGHAFEGRKPAFVDDLSGLVIGPLFVLAEIGFMLGLRRSIEAEIVRQAGPLR